MALCTNVGALSAQNAALGGAGRRGRGERRSYNAKGRHFILFIKCQKQPTPPTASLRRSACRRRRRRRRRRVALPSKRQRRRRCAARRLPHSASPRDATAAAAAGAVPPVAAARRRRCASRRLHVASCRRGVLRLGRQRPRRCAARRRRALCAPSCRCCTAASPCHSGGNAPGAAKLVAAASPRALGRCEARC